MAFDTPGWVERTVPRHILEIPRYEPGKPIAELERELGISGAVKMASNENPLGPSPKAVEAMRSGPACAHLYPESEPHDLLSALAHRYGVSPESIIVGNGSDEIMLMAAHVLMTPGAEAVTGAHVFSMYRISVEAFGGKLIGAPMKDHSFDLKAMAAAVTPRTRLVFLTIPNNPTGTIVSRADFEAFLKDLPSEGLVVVIDEAYREYVRVDDCPRGTDYLDGTPPVLVLRTFSKIYGLAGLRVGYGLAAPWLIEIMNRVRPPFNVNCLAQIAARAALADEEHVRRSRETAEQGLAFLETEFDRLGLTFIPSHANFISFRVDSDARRVYEALLREGVIVRRLASFGMSSWIRVTVGVAEDNLRFIRGLERVLE